MEKKETITALLGTTQEEMAMLLQITRAHWSMYESGKRNLPQAASIKLAEMLAHVQSAKAKSSKHPSQLEEKETKEKLQTLLNENNYQQFIMEKKIAGIEKKQAATASALHLLNYFENNKDIHESHTKSLLPTLDARTKKDIQRNGLPTLVTYQIKLKVLHYEASLLKAALEEK